MRRSSRFWKRSLATAWRTRSSAWPTMPSAGEVWAKALMYCRQAGAKAMERSASREAVGCYEQALAALVHLPEHRALREQAVDLRFDLYNARLVLGQHERVLHDLRAAETLAEALDDPRRLGRVSLYMARCFLIARQYDRAMASSQRALALAATSGDNYTPIEAHNFLGLVYFLQGKYRQAMDANRQAMALLEGEQRYERFGQFILPAVRCRTYLSLCLAEVGAFAEGIAVGEEGLHIAEAVQHPVSLVEAYRSVGLPYLRQGNLYQALPLLERAVGLCEEADLPFLFSLAAPALGAAYVLCGRADEAVRLLERVIEQTTSSSGMGGQVLLLFTLGEAHLHAGRLEEARTLATRAIEHARTYQGRGNEAYILRLLGDIATHRDPPEVAEAEASYCQAMALASELGMRPLLAHCHLGLGSLYAKTGQQERARIELSAAIDLYRAMDMTFWLPQAEATLAQVEGR
jgi:tetratricopeptide (TPR) repeat protein